MLKFYGSRFVKALDDLSAIRAIAMTVKGKHLDPETRASVLGHMRDLSVQLHVMGLNLTRMSLMRLIGKIDSDPELDARVEHLLSEIQLRLQDELEDTLLFSIPTNAHLFRQSEPIFGSEVEKKFGAASFDISEAGKCLALRRGTASVFHLMRVVEVGIEGVRKCLGIPDPTKDAERNWGPSYANSKQKWMEGTALIPLYGVATMLNFSRRFTPLLMQSSRLGGTQRCMSSASTQKRKQRTFWPW